MRRPDSTTRWLLQDQQSSGLSLSEYERQHSLIFEELPRPSPATQRIRRHETRGGAMDDDSISQARSRAKRRTRLPKGPGLVRESDMASDMAAARREFYATEKLMGGSGLSCVVCGNSLPEEEFSQLLTCDACHGQLVQRAFDLEGQGR